MERDGLGLHFALLDIEFVAAKHDGDVLTDADKVAYSGKMVSSKKHEIMVAHGRFGALLRCQDGTFL